MRNKGELIKANNVATRVDLAYREIKDRILNNVFPPGYQAYELEIADLLQMSRTPVREALIRLEKEGLIKRVPRRGMQVVPLDPQDMREIYQLLTSLEATAAQLLAQRNLTKKQLIPMKEALTAMDNALKNNDLENWAVADEQFHRFLLEQCGNNRLKNIALGFWDQMHRVRLITLKLRPKPVQSNREHWQAYRAICKGDADAARDIHYQHRLRTQEVIMELLDQFPLHHL